MHLTRPIISLALLALATSVMATEPGGSQAGGPKREVARPSKDVIDAMTVVQLRDWAIKSPTCTPGRRLGKYEVQCKARQSAQACMDQMKEKDTVVTGLLFVWKKRGRAQSSQICEHPIITLSKDMPRVGLRPKRGQCCAFKHLGILPQSEGQGSPSRSIPKSPVEPTIHDGPQAGRPVPKLERPAAPEGMDLAALRDWAKKSPTCLEHSRFAGFVVTCQRWVWVKLCLAKNQNNVVVTGMALTDRAGKDGLQRRYCRYPVSSAKNGLPDGGPTMEVLPERRGTCCTIDVGASNAGEGPQNALVSGQGERHSNSPSMSEPHGSGSGEPFGWGEHGSGSGSRPPDSPVQFSYEKFAAGWAEANVGPYSP